MARKPRIHFPAALYHVMLRGNARQDIFFEDEDRPAASGREREIRISGSRVLPYDEPRSSCGPGGGYTPVSGDAEPFLSLHKVGILASEPLRTSLPGTVQGVVGRCR